MESRDGPTKKAITDGSQGTAAVSSALAKIGKMSSSGGVSSSDAAGSKMTIKQAKAVTKNENRKADMMRYFVKSGKKKNS